MAAAKLATLPVGANQHAQICAPSQDAAAELLNVSRSAVQRAAKVRDGGTAELIAAVEQGEMAVSDADPSAAILERAQRIYEYQQHCKAEHGKQGGSHFTQFMLERFGMPQSTASHWALLGAASGELSSIATKFAPDWTTFYDFTRLPEPAQQQLLESDQQIDRKAVHAAPRTPSTTPGSAARS